MQTNNNTTQEKTIRGKALEWWSNIYPISKRMDLREKYYQFRTGNVADEMKEHIYLSEYPQPQEESKEEGEGGKWFWNDIDGDCAICDDNGFILEAPNEKTGKRIVKAVNNFDALKENLERILDRIEESNLQGNFPSAYQRAKAILNNINNQ